MSMIRELRRRGRHVVVPTLWVLVTGYFGFHAVNGDYGLSAWFQLNQEITTAEAELASVEATRAELDHRVGLMRRDSIDPDLLDEQARRSLGFVAGDEVVILGNP